MDDLSLGLTITAVDEFLNTRALSCSTAFADAPPIRGARCPTTPDEARILLDKLDSAGAAYSNPFETPARRVLTDETLMRRVRKRFLDDRIAYPRKRVTIEMDAR